MATRDYDVGGRTGGGEYNAQLAKIQRANRLSTLKLEDRDLSEDQNLFRNQYGLLECKLCCTHHRTEASYIAHTYGQQHRRNLERRKVVLARKEAMAGGCRAATQPKPQAPSKMATIGDPAYNVYKNKDASGSLSILFEVNYEQIRRGTVPKYRIMSTFEQHVEPPDPKYQFVLFAAQPYNTIAFKIPNLPVMEDKIIEEWKPNENLYTFQITVGPPQESPSNV